MDTNLMNAKSIMKLKQKIAQKNSCLKSKSITHYLILPILTMFFVFNISLNAQNLDSGLVLCLPFNGNANDESGNGNDGEVMGATLTTDRFGNPNSAYYFDGNDWINVKNSDNLNALYDAYTISVWVYAQASQIYPLCKSAYQGFSIHFRLCHGFSVIYNGNCSDYSYNAPVDSWTHIALVINKGTCKLLINNKELTTGSYTNNCYPFNSNFDLSIGRDPHGVVEYHKGKIDDIRIYNRALTQTEITSLYQNNISCIGIPQNIDVNLQTQADANQGKTTGTGAYKKDDSVIVSATPNDCYHFVHWEDTEGNILALKQTDTINLKSDSTIIAVFEKDMFEISTSPNIADAGTTTGNGTYDCGDTAFISATPNDCYHFVHWKDIEGNILALKQTDTINLKSDSIIIAVFEKDMFELNVAAEPIYAGIATGSGDYYCDSVIMVSAVAEQCYEFVCWIDAISGDTISLMINYSIKINRNRNVIAIFKNIYTDFVIRVDDHSDVLPTLTSYTIPIYIQANNNKYNVGINKLIVSINKTLFYPVSVSAGTMNRNEDEITISNFSIPYLAKGEESILCTISGIPLLGDTTLSTIDIKNVQFADGTCDNTEYTDGVFSIAICVNGGNRLVKSGVPNEIIIEENPAKDILKVKCSCLEKGNYTLEIADISGNTKIIKKWDNNFSQIYDYKIGLSDFPKGSYILIMKTPSSQYIDKFVVK